MSTPKVSESSGRLKQAISYFMSHQDEFARAHHGKYVVIYENKVEGFFDSALDAYSEAKSLHPSGDFLLRACIKSEEEASAILRSRVAG